MRIVRWIALVSALAVATAFLGWWSVPLLGGLWGLFRSPRSAALEAGSAAAAAWAALLGFTALQGPVWYLAGTLGGIFRLPGPVVLLLTLVYPAVLAGAAAALVAALRAAIGVQRQSA